MRHYFETEASTLIEVDLYKRAQKLPSGPGRHANISGVDFSGVSGSSGVDIRWHHPNSSSNYIKNRNKSQLIGGIVTAARS